MSKQINIPTKSKVLVIGGGPAGSTAACLLARQGIEVTLLERDKFPRYHVGESLLPSVLKVLDLLDVREKVEEFGFTHKHGGFLEWGTEKWTVEFGILGNNKNYSFQVTRADFDDILLRHASEQGVRVIEEVKVDSLDFDGDRPVAAKWSRDQEGKKESGRIEFDYLVDASGRAGIVATKFKKSRQNHKIFRNVAIWGYWKNTQSHEAAPKGAIYTVAIPNGWFWGIPLHDGTMSIGLVIHKDALKEARKTKDLLEVYKDAIANSDLMREVTENAELVTELKTETDYSYAAEEFQGPGYFMIGDAACFLDPLLSSGVHLAMFSGVLATASINSIERGDVTEAEARNYFERSYRKAYLRLLLFVSTFYNQYDGKETYFWEAHKLTNSDLDGADLKFAFTSLISGLEDMRNVSEEVNQKVLDEMKAKVTEKTKQAQEVARNKQAKPDKAFEGIESANQDFFSEKVEGLFTLNPEEAVDGLYVRVDDGIRLDRVMDPKAIELSKAK